MIGIIGAMELEVDALKNMMTDLNIINLGSVDYYQGKINDTDTVVAAAGIGKVNAALCAQAMIFTFKPDVIINIGVAGGLANDLKIGDIAIATSVVEHDMDTSQLGDPKGYITGLNTVYMYCDREIVNVLYDSACSEGGINAKKGVIASGDQFISSTEERKRISDTFDAVAAEMEAAAIGHACLMNNVKFGVLRAISDSANGNSHIDFPTFAKAAAKNTVGIAVRFLMNYNIK